MANEYIPTVWQTGDIITAEKLNKIEDGIAGAPVPTGKKEITSTAEVDVANYATAQVVDEDLVAGNIKKDVDILGVVGTYEAEAIDTIQITYSDPRNLNDEYIQISGAIKDYFEINQPVPCVFEDELTTTPKTCEALLYSNKVVIWLNGVATNWGITGEATKETIGEVGNESTIITATGDVVIVKLYE